MTGNSKEGIIEGITGETTGTAIARIETMVIIRTEIMVIIKTEIITTIRKAEDRAAMGITTIIHTISKGETITNKDNMW